MAMARMVKKGMELFFIIVPPLGPDILANAFTIMAWTPFAYKKARRQEMVAFF